MNLSNVTKKYIGQPFAHYGCIELIVAIMADIGKPLPDQMDGINVSNYNELVHKNIKLAQVTMLKAFRKIGKPVSPKYPGIGDLLVVLQKKNGGLFPAVAMGNGTAIASFIRDGVCLFCLDAYNLPIMARRVY